MFAARRSLTVRTFAILALRPASPRLLRFTFARRFWTRNRPRYFRLHRRSGRRNGFGLVQRWQTQIRHQTIPIRRPFRRWRRWRFSWPTWWGCRFRLGGCHGLFALLNFWWNLDRQLADQIVPF